MNLEPRLVRRYEQLVRSHSDQTGHPLAPLALNVVTKDKVLSTYKKEGCKKERHLEELAVGASYLDAAQWDGHLFNTPTSLEKFRKTKNANSSKKDNQ